MHNVVRLEEMLLVMAILQRKTGGSGDILFLSGQGEGRTFTLRLVVESVLYVYFWSFYTNEEKAPQLVL